MANPRSLGYVTVATPGTLVRATVNQDDPTLGVPAQGLLFQARPGNAGIVYVGDGTLNRASGVGVFAVLPAPSDPTSGPFPSFSPTIPVAPASLNANGFYIDADSGGDGVIISYVAG